MLDRNIRSLFAPLAGFPKATPYCYRFLEFGETFHGKIQKLIFTDAQVANGMTGDSVLE